MNPKCAEMGCELTVQSNGPGRNGVKRYAKYCAGHERQKSELKSLGLVGVPCEACGWDKAKCRRVRVSRAGETRVLCPNCHRLQVLGILEAPRKKFDPIGELRQEALTEAQEVARRVREQLGMTSGNGTPPV